jgi:hypothetical protein
MIQNANETPIQPCDALIAQTTPAINPNPVMARGVMR